MMAFHPRELAAAAVAAEVAMGAAQMMAQAAAQAAAMEMAAAAVVAALTPRSWAELEAQGEPRVPRVPGMPAAAVEREAITALGVPAGMLEAQEAAPETKAQQVQDSLKRDKVEDPIPVVVAALESLPAVAAVGANMESKSSRHFFWDPAVAAAAAMTMARSVEGTEETAAGSFSLWRIQLPSREVLPVLVPPVLLQPPVKELAAVDPVDPF
jgi:hypothetical protein